MLVPIRMGTNMAAGNQQKQLSPSFASKAWIYLSKKSQTLKEYFLQYMNTEKNRFSNLHDNYRLSCKCRVTQKLRNSSLLYHKTKNPFVVKICIKISFQLL